MNQRGMTLVSAMMSVSVSAIALITTFRLVDMAVEVFATLQGTVRAIDTVHEIRFAIGQARICTLNFDDVFLNATTVPVSRKLFYPNPAAPSTKSALEIGAADNHGTVVQIATMTMRRDSANTNLAYLDIDMTRSKGANALPLRKRSIPMIVRTNAVGKIICCSTLEVDQCAEDVNVYAPPGCNGGYCACGGGPPNLCDENPPITSNAICTSRGFARATNATTQQVGPGTTICSARTGACWLTGTNCDVCEVVTCEN